jgi:hypothetical protein
MANVELGTVSTGTAFKFLGSGKERFGKGVFIALALTPDPFSVFCLDTETHKIIRAEESYRVAPFQWQPREVTRHSVGTIITGPPLDVLY